MPRARDFSSSSLMIALIVLAVLSTSPSFAQPASPDRPPAAARPARAVARAAAARPKYRQLAPGVMRTIDPENQVAERVSRHNVVEVLTADPNYAERDWSQGKSPARDTVFRREIWSLEFAFKPVRFVHVDVPTPDGRLQRKLVWYLVYSVKNTGSEPVRFVPQFVLLSKDTGKVYPSRVIPLAIPHIRDREDPNRPLLNTSEMTGKIAPTPKGQDPTVWGVATWEDVDPSTDNFTIYVQGLTNADQWADPPGAYKQGNPPGTGREFFPKTLILNFWRPSDKEEEHEGEIRYENNSWAYGQLTERGFIAKKPDSPPRPIAVPQAVEVGADPDASEPAAGAPEADENP